MENQHSFDVITYGRSSIDLYSNNIGAPFVEIEEFGAFAGGSPLNIAVGTRRLGLKSALLTGIGQDQAALGPDTDLAALWAILRGSCCCGRRPRLIRGHIAGTCRKRI